MSTVLAIASFLPLAVVALFCLHRIEILLVRILGELKIANDIAKLVATRRGDARPAGGAS